jgi:eukaryotic-like serine/threonine-protein kinase
VPNADQIIDLFNEAKARPAGPERERFLTEACRENAGLREQIVSLIEADGDGRSELFDRGLIKWPTILATEKAGDRIGRYKLLENIGEGGCGLVYMAEQEEPVRRRVALKVIKLGMDTKSVIARFEAERQALAMMDHPNIAKVFDAGATETGRPFFVMELVRGIKITEFCDQQNLSTEQRLELFTQVCQAVQHAHQKGIIHRDLKPSNILVTLHDGMPVPKVIDFGVAKATHNQRLTDKTLFTAFEQFIGTPTYMSPEQAEMSGLDVDTRSDIYSLGVLLYELLTGWPPLNANELLQSGMSEMSRRIREDEPPHPSTRLSTMQVADLSLVAKSRQADAPKLIRLVQGDLDWIVMKCLEKDRARRYETVIGLAADIKRYLSSEPVTARPPTRLYRFRKLVRRNKLAVSAATAISVALVSGLCVATWALIRERAARDRAEQAEYAARAEALKSEQAARMIRDMLHGVGPAIRRDTKVLNVVLTETAQRLPELEGQPAVQADVLTILGSAFSELGEHPNAVTMHRRALALRRTLLGNQHPDVAKSLGLLIAALKAQGLEGEANELMRQFPSNDSTSSRIGMESKQ